MAIDFSLPKLTQLYNTELLPSIRENQAGLARMFNGDTLLNTPDKTIRYSESQNRLEIYSTATTTWTPLLPSYLPLAGGTLTGGVTGTTLTLTGTLTGEGITATSLTVAGNVLISSGGTLNAGAAAFGSSVSITGTSLTLNQFSSRFIGRFSGATLSQRTTFITTEANQQTTLQAMPNGTANGSYVSLFNSSDLANSGNAQFGVSGAVASINIQNLGTPTTSLTGIQLAISGTSVLKVEPTIITASQPILLPADPVANLQAATKQYVDSLSAGGHGQCRLTTNGSNLQLVPYNGNKIIVDGISRIVPSGGVLLASTGTLPNTVYRIYTYWTGSALALEYSTTGHSINAANGIEIKTGDPSRTLVGLVCTGASSQWVNSPTQRRVISYFNRRDVPLFSKLNVTGQFGTSTAYANFTVSLIVDFVCWPDESNDFIAQILTYTSGVITTFNTVAIGFDASPGDEGVTAYMAIDPNTKNLTPTARAVLTEDVHSANVMYKSDNGGRVYIDNLASASSLIRGTIRG